VAQVLDALVGAGELARAAADDGLDADAVVSRTTAVASGHGQTVG
jgi:hypothetical protein